MSMWQCRRGEDRGRGTGCLGALTLTEVPGLTDATLRSF